MRSKLLSSISIIENTLHISRVVVYMQKVSNWTQMHFYDEFEMEWSILETEVVCNVQLWKLLYVSFAAGEVTR